jgi:hypothetical protein
VFLPNLFILLSTTTSISQTRGGKVTVYRLASPRKMKAADCACGVLLLTTAA